MENERVLVVRLSEYFLSFEDLDFARIKVLRVIRRINNIGVMINIDDIQNRAYQIKFGGGEE